MSSWGRTCTLSTNGAQCRATQIDADRIEVRRATAVSTDACICMQVDETRNVLRLKAARRQVQHNSGMHTYSLHGQLVNWMEFTLDWSKENK